LLRAGRMEIRVFPPQQRKHIEFFNVKEGPGVEDIGAPQGAQLWEEAQRTRWWSTRNAASHEGPGTWVHGVEGIGETSSEGASMDLSSYGVRPLFRRRKVVYTRPANTNNEGSGRGF